MNALKLTRSQINSIATKVKALFREDVPENETDPNYPDFSLLYFPETGQVSFDPNRYPASTPPVIVANFSKNQIITMSDEDIAFYIWDFYRA